jgi:DNA-binding NarL/FixJ family response regulator
MNPKNSVEVVCMRVIVVDDSVLLREGIVLEDAAIEVVAQLGDTTQLVEHVGELDPELVILDIRMPPTHTTEGLEAAVVLRNKFPNVAVLLLSQYVESRYAIDLIEGDAKRVGYLLKDRVANIREFIAAVHHVANGGTLIDATVVSRLVGRERRNNPISRLSEREREVLSLMAEGRSNSSIADHLVLNGKTIESHVRSIFTKLDLDIEVDDHRRVRAVLFYLAHHDQTS